MLTLLVGMIEKNPAPGIDPGTNTGIAIYDPFQNKIVKTHSTDFFGAIQGFKNFGEK